MPIPRRVLVANRGEIAVRVIRACRDLGIQTVAVYSEADRHSLHAHMADVSVCIGPPAASESYLSIPALIEAAVLTRADAVHPGYGFLAENAAFAEACEAHGVCFIGPTPESIRLIGDKAKARQTAASLGVPIVPGSSASVADASEIDGLARRVGFPLLLKAVAGGGGRGMQLVRTAAALVPAFQQGSAEAAAAFGDGTLYLERFLENVRHVEVQVLGDGRDRWVHVGERDCTIQRRHQKLLEEAPSPALSPHRRSEIAAAALAICEHLRYRNAGTVEFLLDLDRDTFYFIEMNTRLQVEHPVTELLYGVDLVVEQIRLAAGEGTSLRNTSAPLGHAIECRINAEDPDAGFQPCPGHLEAFRMPAGPWLRVDTHCYSGYVVPPYYDSLIAKVIAIGRTRDEATRRMQRALAEFEIRGPKTTLPFHRRLLAADRFVAGQFNTRWLEEPVASAGHLS